ncbi:MAG TPA: carboxypeptidase-like regulatory domain-containing protein, partial [Bryobacteraceae bacterium]|nr:carboxypeptidase-like regulatory domain-containing protein [Bryobacteraceae bacterium]
MRHRLSWWAAMALVWAPVLHAQISGSLAGSVLDPSGAPVPSADVRIRETRTNTERRMGTDSRGQYLAPGLSP